MQLEITGHTDDQGSEFYNLKLSKGRAGAVMDFLAARGIADLRMVAEGKGEQAPMVANDTEAHRAQNRRVAIRFL